MRKLYLTLLTILFLSTMSLGQLLGPAGACDTLLLNDAIQNKWSALPWQGGDHGYNFGVISYQGYHFNQSGNYYDASSTAYNYITGCSVLFLYANSNNSSELNKNVIFKVFNDAGGIPGDLLGSTSLTLGEIKKDVYAKHRTNVIFPAPISLPASKKFYVAVDYSAFRWSGVPGGVRDSLCIAATNDDETENIAYQDITESGGWIPANQFWGATEGDPLDVSLWIFPYLNTDNSGACEPLPVHLLSFTSQRHNNDVALNWQIADEIGMKGYEVQKSGNNGAYSTITFVPALNNAKNQGYSITDKSAFSSSATVQYRLKQIDGDGSVKYSRVLQVKSGSAINDVLFANPFNGALKLSLNLASAQKVSVFVYDMQGRLVASLPQKMYDASTSNLVVQGTENLKPGLYSIKVIAGGEQKVYKAMKQ